MPEYIPVLNKEAIAPQVAVVTKRISIDYHNGDLVIIGVLKCAIILMADMIRQLTLDFFVVDFMPLASCGKGYETSRCTAMHMDVDTDATLVDHSFLANNGSCYAKAFLNLTESYDLENMRNTLKSKYRRLCKKLKLRLRESQDVACKWVLGACVYSYASGTSS